MRWDAWSLELVDRVPYNREGWGMCAADGYVMTSDGRSELVRREPQTLEPQAIVHVRCAGRRVLGLNDLAWSGGTIWANVGRLQPHVPDRPPVLTGQQEPHVW